MKKVLMLLLVLFCLFQISEVKAQTYKLTLKRQEGIYYARRGGTLPYKSSQFSIYMFDDNIAYCIEPSKNIETWNYVSTDGYIDLPYSDELKKELELIGYYGREYPGHDNVRYSMAAQALIWEKTGYDSVTFWTEKDEQGEQIDVSSEKEEIMRLVNRHKILPNLPNKVNGYVNKELTIKDSNSVLNDFKIVSSDFNDISIQNNSIKLIPKKIGESKIVIERKKYDNLDTLIFVGENNDSSQTLGRLRFSNKQQAEIKVDVNGIKLLVSKVDEQGNNVSLKNIKFKIKDLSTNSYICQNNDCNFLTNSDGTFITNELLFGRYEIEEDLNQIIKGYIVNKENKIVEINENSQIKWNEANKSFIEVEFSNKKIPTQFTLYKRGQEMISSNNKITYRIKMLENIEFDLFDSDLKYLKTIKTDKNGTAILNDLPVGFYSLKEKTKRDDYVEDNTIYSFELKQYNPNATLVSSWIIIENVLKKGNVEISKIDDDTKVGIPNTTISLYDENDNLILTEDTDSNGKIYIENLSYGKYYLKEIRSHELYELNNEKIYFEIKNDQEIKKITMTNKKIMGNLDVYKTIFDNNTINYKNIGLGGITFKIFDNNNNLIRSIKTDSSGYIKVNSLPLGKYYLIEENSNPSYQNNSTKYYFEIKKDSNNMAIDVKLNIYNYLKKGNLVFYKIDSENNVGIKDTLIGIYDLNNELLLSKKTDNEGKMIIDNLPVGKYYLKELEANYYYQKSNEIIYFEIEENKITEKTMANKKIVGSLEIIKNGENYHFINNSIYYEKGLLHGIEFSLYSDNKFIKDIRCDDKGYIKMDNLPLGKYYVIEKTKLEKYQDNNDKYEFEIKKNSNNEAINVKLEINNFLKKGNLVFYKKDSETKEGIKDTVIELYDANNHLLLTYKTDEKGTITINNLPYGKYYLKEKESNYYYQKSDEIINFEINSNKETIVKEMINKKILGNIEVNKYGEKHFFKDNNIYYEMVPLASIIFDLYDINNTFIKEVKTDNNGYFKISKLPLGKYYLIEKNSNTNYLVNEKYEFEIMKDNNKAIDVKVRINNYLKKGHLEFSKEDLTTGIGIPNTIIEIYNDENQLLFTKETDESGKVIINDLPLGKYYIIEKEANELYQITNEKVLFEIRENEEIVKTKMTNEKKEIEVPKTGKNDKKIVNSFSFLGVIFCLGWYYYERKEAI